MIGCSDSCSNKYAAVLLATGIWLPGRVGLPGDCFRNWGASWERIQNETVREAWPGKKRTPLFGGKAGFDSLGLAPLHPASFRYYHIRGPGRKETLNTKRAVFSKKKKIWLAGLYFFHCFLDTPSLWESWLIPAAVGFFIPFSWWVWLTQPDSEHQHLASVFKFSEWNKHLASSVFFGCSHIPWTSRGI